LESNTIRSGVRPAWRAVKVEPALAAA